LDIIIKEILQTNGPLKSNSLIEKIVEKGITSERGAIYRLRKAYNAKTNNWLKRHPEDWSARGDVWYYLSGQESILEERKGIYLRKRNEVRYDFSDIIQHWMDLIPKGYFDVVTGYLIIIEHDKFGEIINIKEISPDFTLVHDWDIIKEDPLFSKLKSYIKNTDIFPYNSIPNPINEHERCKKMLIECLAVRDEILKLILKMTENLFDYDVFLKMVEQYLSTNHSRIDFSGLYGLPEIFLERLLFVGKNKRKSRKKIYPYLHFFKSYLLEDSDAFYYFIRFGLSPYEWNHFSELEQYKNNIDFWKHQSSDLEFEQKEYIPVTSINKNKNRQEIWEEYDKKTELFFNQIEKSKQINSMVPKLKQMEKNLNDSMSSIYSGLRLLENIVW